MYPLLFFSLQSNFNRVAFLNPLTPDLAELMVMITFDVQHVTFFFLIVLTTDHLYDCVICNANFHALKKIFCQHLTCLGVLQMFSFLLFLFNFITAVIFALDDYICE